MLSCFGHVYLVVLKRVEGGDTSVIQETPSETESLKSCAGFRDSAAAMGNLAGLYPL
jgi:hypothetical protein